MVGSGMRLRYLGLMVCIGLAGGAPPEATLGAGGVERGAATYPWSRGCHR